MGDTSPAEPSWCQNTVGSTEALSDGEGPTTMPRRGRLLAGGLRRVAATTSVLWNTKRCPLAARSAAPVHCTHCANSKRKRGERTEGTYGRDDEVAHAVAAPVAMQRLRQARARTQLLLGRVGLGHCARQRRAVARHGVRRVQRQSRTEEQHGLRAPGRQPTLSRIDSPRAFMPRFENKVVQCLQLITKTGWSIGGWKCISGIMRTYCWCW